MRCSTPICSFACTAPLTQPCPVPLSILKPYTEYWRGVRGGHSRLRGHRQAPCARHPRARWRRRRSAGRSRGTTPIEERGITIPSAIAAGVRVTTSVRLARARVKPLNLQ
eukprot:scaffold31813_cov62-Phaeocystis_antarctica.AAC.2